MESQADRLRARTKRFAFDIIELIKVLPRAIVTDAVARQLIRSATSIASNYRSAGRARSRREFVAKLGVVLEEADESEFWLEALTACQLVAHGTVEPLRLEACELRAIFSAAVTTARSRQSPR